MSRKSDRKKTHILEKRLYEYLGIQVFKKLVLKFEQFRHHKSNAKNVNYHLSGSSINSVRSFTGYLLYNAVCHSISLAFVAVYFSITWVTGVKYVALNILMCVLLIVNLYCIMLQRYTYIKIKKYKKKQIDAKNHRIADKVECLLHRVKHKDYDELQKDFLLIERIKESIYNGTDCVIEECDVAVLNSISKCAQDIFGKSSCFKCGDNNEISLETAIRTIPKEPVVVNKVTRRAAELQNVFCCEKQSNVLFGFSIITETDECEAVYKALVQDAKSRDSVEFVFDVLFEAYNKALLFSKGIQT